MFKFEKQKELLLSIIKENNLKKLNVILGISGGVDSAVTYKILKLLANEISELNVYPVLIPIYNSIGSTEQEEAYYLGKLLCGQDDNLLEPDPHYVAQASKALSLCMGNENNSYLTGQSDYWIRPTLLYNTACMYTANDSLGIVCGTINKSEYETGFFGKKTDTCDIQLINTYTKTEVYKLAKILEIPLEITNTKPKGNVHDGKTDEEILSMSYVAIDGIINNKRIYTNYFKFRQLQENSKHKKVIFRGIDG
jgi:NAD+ synthetase